MVVALAIDWPTGPFWPVIGTSNAMRCRVSSLGRLSVGSGAGVWATGPGRSAPFGITAQAPSNAASPTVTIARRSIVQRFILPHPSFLVHG